MDNKPNSWIGSTVYLTISKRFGKIEIMDECWCLIKSDADNNDFPGTIITEIDTIQLVSPDTPENRLFMELKYG